MIARTHTVQPGVLGGMIITVEADVVEQQSGRPEFTLVGLAGRALDEAHERVSTALKNAKLPSPTIGNQRIVISLAPADVKKDGPLFDLPIAIAYLCARGHITGDVEHTVYIGELSLDGTLRSVRGVLSAAVTAKQAGFTTIIVPEGNAAEAALVDDITVYSAKTLSDVVCHIQHPGTSPLISVLHTTLSDTYMETCISLEDIRGQETAKRGLIIAAAGKHNAILVGPPGTGKTMLARALPGILPPLSLDEALEVTAIHSYAGTLRGAISAIPPFRSPHHSASHTALVGGGSNPRPGEVTLAHRGILFLDEFPEFDRRSIDGLRQPLEDRVVSISRVSSSVQFPANFMLIAAMNPSRGGAGGDNYTEQMLETYKNKISGPILDRIDLWLPVPHIPHEALAAINTQTGETERAREEILRARERQAKRFANHSIAVNGEMSARTIDETIELSAAVRELLVQSAQKLKLSPRSYHRLVKTARTIADLAEAEDISEMHVFEALQYRVSV